MAIRILQFCITNNPHCYVAKNILLLLWIQNHPHVTSHLPWWVSLCSDKVHNSVYCRVILGMITGTASEDDASKFCNSFWILTVLEVPLIYSGQPETPGTWGITASIVTSYRHSSTVGLRANCPRIQIVPLSVFPFSMKYCQLYSNLLQCSPLLLTPAIHKYETKRTVFCCYVVVLHE